MWRILPGLVGRTGERFKVHPRYAAFIAASSSTAFGHSSVDEALREIDKSEAKLLRSDLAHYLALRGQYDRARVVAVAPFTSPLSTSSWLALWLGEGGHAELRDRALRDAYDHVRPHPPQMRDFDLKTLAQSHAHATLFDAAFNVVNDINTPVEKMNAYAAVGERAFIKGRRGVVARVLKEAQAVPLGIGSYCQFNLAELAAQFGDREAFDHFATLSERTLNEYTYWSRAKHLAKGYAIFDMRDQHRLLMDKALKALSAKDADDKDGGARLALAASYVFLNEDKRVADAIAAAKKLDRRAVEGYSFWEIFEAYLDHGRINDARALMAKWVPEDDRDTFHTSLALTLVRKRELAAARKELGHIKHSSLPHTVMSLLARAYARAGRLDDAAKWIDSFESPRTRAALNLAIANALAGRENYYSRILYPDWDQRR